MFGNTTDPADHNPNDYRYMLHAVAETKPMAWTANAGRLRPPVSSSEAKGFGKIVGNPLIDLYSQPERLAEKMTICLSLVDQNKPNIFGSSNAGYDRTAGIIAGVPQKNVIACAIDDLHSDRWNVHQLNEKRKGFKRESEYRDHPERLIEATRDHWYAGHNEIVALGSYKGNELSVAGFFYKVDANGDAMNRKDMKVFSKHAKRLGLPLVKIPERSDHPEFYQDHTPSLKEELKRFAVNVIPAKNSKMPRPEDVEEVLTHGIKLAQGEDFMQPERYLEKRSAQLTVHWTDSVDDDVIDKNTTLVKTYSSELLHCLIDLKKYLSLEQMKEAMEQFISSNKLDETRLGKDCSPAVVKFYNSRLNEIKSSMSTSWVKILADNDALAQKSSGRQTTTGPSSSGPLP